jgi:hypothetical protein
MLIRIPGARQPFLDRRIFVNAIAKKNNIFQENDRIAPGSTEFKGLSKGHY